MVGDSMTKKGLLLAVVTGCIALALGFAYRSYQKHELRLRIAEKVSADVYSDLQAIYAALVIVTDSKNGVVPEYSSDRTTDELISAVSELLLEDETRLIDRLRNAGWRTWQYEVTVAARGKRFTSLEDDEFVVVVVSTEAAPYKGITKRGEVL